MTCFKKIDSAVLLTEPTTTSVFGCCGDCGGGGTKLDVSTRASAGADGALGGTAGYKLLPATVVFEALLLLIFFFFFFYTSLKRPITISSLAKETRHAVTITILNKTKKKKKKKKKKTGSRLP